MSAPEPPEPIRIPTTPARCRSGPSRSRPGQAGAGGAGGWGRAPRVEPFAVAALVWAIVSIVIPLIGTIVAFVLAARAADLIRRSHGEKSGTQYVTAARIVAGAVLALWVDRAGRVPRAARRRLVEQQRGGAHAAADHHDRAATTSTTAPLTTTSTKPPVTTTSTEPPPTITVVPPPPTTRRRPRSRRPPAPPPTTVAAHDGRAHDRRRRRPRRRPPPQAAAHDHPRRGEGGEGPGQAASSGSGPSNRGVPADERVRRELHARARTCSSPGRSTTARSGSTRRARPTCTAPPTEAPASSTSTTLDELDDHDHHDDHDRARPDHRRRRGRSHDAGAGALRGQADARVDPSASSRR